MRRRLAEEKCEHAAADEVDQLADLIGDAEVAILEAPVTDDRDALAVAIMAAAWWAPGEACAPAYEGAILGLLAHLAKRAGLDAADLGLASYWRDVHQTPQRWSMAAKRDAPETTQPRPTLRAQLEALRAAVPSGSIMGLRIGDFVDFYGDDAQHVSETLRIVLNQRRDGEGGTIELCGMPAPVFEYRRQEIEKACLRVTLVDVAA